MRGKKTENGDNFYYLRSSVLSGQVVAEIYGGGVSYAGSGWWLRGYVYLGGQMVATQAGGVNWVHQDPVTKSQRITDGSGNITYTVDLDPWGGETGRTSGTAAFQPHRFTSYERDANGGDDAMMRRYQGAWSRFAQPDPYEGSYDLTDPQSLNRYAYVQSDPVNFVDPIGLIRCRGCYDPLDWRSIFESGGRDGWPTRLPPYVREPHEPFEPQKPKPPGQPPKSASQEDLQALFDKVKKACVQRKNAEANAERNQYNANFPSRLRRSAIFGGIRGAAMGGYAGFNGGESLEPLGGGLPGAAGGAVVGGIFGTAAGVIWGGLTEPFYRAYHNRSTYRPAVNRIEIDCDAEARTAVNNAILTGGRR